MKILAFVLAIMFSSYSIGQNISKINLTKDGFVPSSIIVHVDSINSKMIYEKTLAWIKRTYEYPDKVIITTIENSMIRIMGNQNVSHVQNLLGKSFSINLSYTLEIEIKDNKYKLSFYNFESTYDTHRKIFNKKGATRDDQGERIRIDLKDALNNLITSLNSSITDKTGDW